MKVLHIIPSFHPAYVYGGPIELSYNLCHELAQHGCDIKVLTTDANGPHSVLKVAKGKEVEVTGGVNVRYCKRMLRDSVSLEILRLLPSYISWADIVHLHAVYSFPTIPTFMVSAFLGKPVIWSPHGALQRWEGTTRIRSKRLWEWFCQLIVPKKLVLHVTSEQEAQESSASFPGIELAVVPPGIDLPDKIMFASSDGTLRLLYLGRLHPKKGIENLLIACKLLKDNLDLTWSLIIAGSGEPSYTEILRAKVETLGLAGQVTMIGFVIDRAKRSLFEHADIIIVPSYTENFGIVVTEALAHGIPVIASKGTPWRRLEEMKCGLWITNDPETLAKSIEQMSRLPLREMGERGRLWTQMEFAWGVRAHQMLQIYERVLSSF